jgi:hypothetical protein
LWRRSVTGQRSRKRANFDINSTYAWGRIASEIICFDRGGCLKKWIIERNAWEIWRGQ